MTGLAPILSSLSKNPPSSAPTTAQALREALREACAAPASATRSRVISTGLFDLDQALPGGGLTCAGIHEWLGVSESDDPQHASRSPHWSPPLTMLALLATRALIAAEHSRAHRNPCVLWIGRVVSPYAPALPRHVLDRSLFIHAPHPADRLWAADLALRSRAAAAVILDASGLDLAATRRLQLAAESGGGGGAGLGAGTLCLLARPPRERSILSAATTRWSIRRAVSPHHTRRWTVELLRCKGVRPTDHAFAHTRAWTLEHTHATRALAVVPDILDGSHPSQAEADHFRKTA